MRMAPDCLMKKNTRVMKAQVDCVARARRGYETQPSGHLLVILRRRSPEINFR